MIFGSALNGRPILALGHGRRLLFWPECFSGFGIVEQKKKGDPMIRLINLLLCWSIVAIAAGVAWVLSIKISWKLLIVIGVVGILLASLFHGLLINFHF